MQYITCYDSPLGEMVLSGDAVGLTGLWFSGEKHCAARLDSEHEAGRIPATDAAERWLNVYFTGKNPGFMPPLHLRGTPFRMAVWALLLEIPYGQVATYGEIARKIAEQRGIPRMSAQAVGGAVGHNDISIIVPCHRVVGSDGSLTGYGGGLGRKQKLLELEGAAAHTCPYVFHTSTASPL